MNTWRTLRAVVEVPVRGDYTERDLARDLAQVLGQGGALLRRGITFGRMQVKEFARVAARLQPSEERAIGQIERAAAVMEKAAKLIGRKP